MFIVAYPTGSPNACPKNATRSSIGSSSLQLCARAMISASMIERADLIVNWNTPKKCVNFALDNSTIHHYETETGDEANTWYSRAEHNSFKRDVITNVRAFRASTHSQEQTNNIAFVGEEHCIYGIENLVLVTMSRNILITKVSVVNAVLEEQSRQNLNGFSNAIRIAQASSYASSLSSKKAQLLGMRCANA